MGKAIVSTPYWYAEEMLSDNLGLLVDFGDTEGFKKSLLYLIENPEQCNIMRQNAYDFGRKMIWENIGNEYTTVFHEALNNYTTYPKIRNIVNFLPNMLPGVKVDQLKLLNDNLAIIQHTSLDVSALHHEYNTDDGVRRLPSDPKKGDFNLK
jgi:hypothetical protein